MDGGISAGASAKTATHIIDHQHWVNRRCSDHLPEKGTEGVLPAEQRGANCWTQWTEDIVNTNATTGLSLLANCGFFSSSVCGSAWYVGIVGATSTFASGDTMASHTGFSVGWTYLLAAVFGTSQTSYSSRVSRKKCGPFFQPYIMLTAKTGGRFFFPTMIHSCLCRKSGHPKEGLFFDQIITPAR